MARSSKGDAMPAASSEVVRWIEGSLDRIIDAGGIPAERILDEAGQRGLLVRGEREAERVRSLQDNDLGVLDAMARSAVRTYAVYGGAQGFVTGLGGVLTLPVSVPTDVAAYLLWIVRVNSAVMQTYGFEVGTEEGRTMLRLGLAAGLGVSKISVFGSQVLVDVLARQVMTSTSRSAVSVATVQAIARRVGLSLSRRSIAKAVPVVGGAINAGVSGGLVYGFGRGAMQHYRGVLLARGTVIDLG